MNYIGLGIDPMTVNGTLFDVDIPVNGKGGDVYGLELTFQTKFYFLPGFLSDFGIYSNASFADSNIKEFHRSRTRIRWLASPQFRRGRPMVL